MLCHCLCQKTEDINVGGIPEFDVEPFTVTVIKFVINPKYLFDAEGEAAYVQLSRMAFGEEESLWERQKAATAAKAAAQVARDEAAKA